MAMDYQKGTPSDYQAPLFHNGDENVSRLLNLGHFNENLTMKTGFHRCAEIVSDRKEWNAYDKKGFRWYVASVRPTVYAGTPSLLQ